MLWQSLASIGQLVTISCSTPVGVAIFSLIMYYQNTLIETFPKMHR